MTPAELAALERDLPAIAERAEKWRYSSLLPGTLAQDIRRLLAYAEHLRAELAAATAAVAELHRMVARGEHGSVAANLSCAVSAIHDIRASRAEAEANVDRLEKELAAERERKMRWKALARFLRDALGVRNEAEAEALLRRTT